MSSSLVIDNKDDLAESESVGSNMMVLVEHSGIEPLTSWVRSRRSPS